MSIDRSLRVKGDLRGARSVLTRAERIARMVEEGKFDPKKDSALGLPKTRVKASKAGTKATKKEDAPAAEAAEAAAE